MGGGGGGGERRRGEWIFKPLDQFVVISRRCHSRVMDAVSLLLFCLGERER